MGRIEKLLFSIVLGAFCLGSTAIAQSKRPTMRTRLATLCQAFGKSRAVKAIPQIDEIHWEVESATATDVRIYNAMIQGLLNRQQPKFLEFEPHDVQQSMRKAFESPRYFEILSAKVAEVSGGQLRLVDMDPEKFPYKVTGTFRFMELISKSWRDEKLGIGIGPYARPVHVFKTRRGFWTPWF